MCLEIKLKQAWRIGGATGATGGWSDSGTVYVPVSRPLTPVARYRSEINKKIQEVPSPHCHEFGMGAVVHNKDAEAWAASCLLTGSQQPLL